MEEKATEENAITSPITEQPEPRSLLFVVTAWTAATPSGLRVRVTMTPAGDSPRQMEKLTTPDEVAELIRSSLEDLRTPRDA